MLKPSSATNQHSYATIGAGALASHLQRTTDATDGWIYRFNVFRLEENGEVTRWGLLKVFQVCQNTNDEESYENCGSV